MKITEVKPFVVDHWVYIKIVTDEGIYGIGEASLGSREMAVVEAIRHVTPLLVGEDPGRIEFIWQDIFRTRQGGPVLQAVLSGIDLALWDIQGKALGVPVYRLLGGPTRDKVLFYRHTGGRTPEQAAENAQRLVEEEGCKVIRISPVSGTRNILEPGPAVRKSVRHFRAIRDAVGEEMEIIFEVHTRLDPPRAIELCNAISEFRPFFVEDPIRSENPASFALLRQHIHVPIGTGEKFNSKWQFRELIEGDLIDYLRIDLCRVGGITEGKKVAAMGETHYQDLALHHTISSVNTIANIHLNAGVPNCAVQEYGAPPAWMADLFKHLPVAEDGYLLLPDRPGLGLEFDEEVAAAHPYRPSERTRLRRLDGSVQNW